MENQPVTNLRTASLTSATLRASARAALVLIATTGVASANTFTVTTTQDLENGSDGVCSLREAIEGLSTTRDASSVTATTSTHTIQLGVGTYCLSSEVEVLANVTLRGVAGL